MWCRPPVIHRDIKPENVILESGKPGSRVLLVDFGGVQEVVSTSATDNAFGTTIVGTAGTHRALELARYLEDGWM